MGVKILCLHIFLWLGVKKAYIYTQPLKTTDFKMNYISSPIHHVSYGKNELHSEGYKEQTGGQAATACRWWTLKVGL